MARRGRRRSAPARRWRPRRKVSLAHKVTIGRSLNINPDPKPTQLLAHYPFSYKLPVATDATNKTATIDTATATFKSAAFPDFNQSSILGMRIDSIALWGDESASASEAPVGMTVQTKTATIPLYSRKDWAGKNRRPVLCYQVPLAYSHDPIVVTYTTSGGIGVIGFNGVVITQRATLA